MYIFTYASSDESTDELYAEYHLGRRAFRACKKGTKFCGWDRHMPAFHHWQHLCKFTFFIGLLFKIISPGLLYDAMKDQYKVISDGEKVESGSWSDSPYVLRPFFPNKIQKHIFSWLTQMVSSSLDRTKMSWRVVTTGEMVLVHENGT